MRGLFVSRILPPKNANFAAYYRTYEDGIRYSEIAKTRSPLRVKTKIEWEAMFKNGEAVAGERRSPRSFTPGRWKAHIFLLEFSVPGS